MPQAQTIELPETPAGKNDFPYRYWNSKLPELKKIYSTQEPYSHIVIDDFLPLNIAEKALSEFPTLGGEDWIHYVHVNERKYGKTDRFSFGPTLKMIIEELNSPDFMSFLSELTGIKGLFPDEKLDGGGLHQSSRGGFLNIHADFTAHPHHNDWRRRVNLLIYLNKNWQDAYNGHLELWDKQMRYCVKKVLPVFNRCVIFNTDADSFHGHPEPLTCPETTTRKSIALYYFTQEGAENFIRSTEYRARPGDGIKSIFIYLDKMLLRGYDAFKRTFKIEDRFVSNVLRQLDRLNPFKKK